MVERLTYYLSPGDCADHLQAQVRNRLGKDLERIFIFGCRPRITLIDLY